MAEVRPPAGTRTTAIAKRKHRATLRRRRQQPGEGPTKRLRAPGRERCPRSLEQQGERLQNRPEIRARARRASPPRQARPPAPGRIARDALDRTPPARRQRRRWPAGERTVVYGTRPAYAVPRGPTAWTTSRGARDTARLAQAPTRQLASRQRKGVDKRSEPCQCRRRRRD